MKIKRFIISIDDQSGDFEISTPDGYIEYSILVNTIDLILGLLLEHIPEEDIYDQDEEPTPVDDPKKLN